MRFWVKPLSTFHHHLQLRSIITCASLSHKYFFHSFPVYSSRNPLLCLKPLFKGNNLFNVASPATSFNSLAYFHAASQRYGSSDPYTILGIPRNATHNEIKRRYRELAKQHHPDLNPGNPDTAKKMAGISAAYQLLSNPKKKQFYDQTGLSPDDTDMNFSNTSGGASPWGNISSFFTTMFQNPNTHHRFRHGDDVVVEVTLDFLEAAGGCYKIIRVPLDSPCKDCKGSGSKSGTTTKKCSHCNGSGVSNIHQGSLVYSTLCQACQGSGFIIEHPCSSCHGSGLRREVQTIELDFPEGTRHGMELHLANKGHHGFRGSKSGDLYVKVSVRPHIQFQIKQDDLHVTVPLSIKTCLLGGSVIVPSLAGPYKLNLENGIQLNKPFSIRHKGLKKLNNTGYGDLVIHWNLNQPKYLTDEQKQLLIKFDKLCIESAEKKK